MRVRWVAAVAAVLAIGPAGVGSAADPLPDGVIAPNVSIDGIAVGGLTVDVARRAVLDQRILPRQALLIVSVNGRRTGLKPVALGYTADLKTAMDQAYAYGRTVPIAAPVNVVLNQTVDRAAIKDVLAFRAKDVELAAIDAKLIFRNARPTVRKGRLGEVLDIPKAVPVVADALLTRAVPVVELPYRRVRPARTLVGPSIVVSRGNRTLTLYREAKVWRTFRVAVGQPAYPTPKGLFAIVEKQRNPTWNPPDSRWARGLGPVAPGAGNPLGTRWMGTSAPAIGIHGTPSSGSIGTAASHGCIRMYINQAEWLYERISVGTPVLIV